jgi:type VI protein secretion system component Hcp
MAGKCATTRAELEAIMSKRDSIARTTACDQSKLVELSEQQLDNVAGGDIHITKTIDQASPNPFMNCCTGKHIASS